VDENRLSNEIIGAAIEVHRALGPGLLESIYENALVFELEQRQIKFRRQVEMPVVYKGHRIEGHLRLDIVVADSVIIEVKAVERLLDVHKAQLLSYLRLANKRLGLLINFNTPVLFRSIKRVVNDL
jgi:GxxExxY protein